MASQLDLFGLGVPASEGGGDDGASGPTVPLGVHTKRDDKQIGKRADSKAHKVTRYFPGKAPKWITADKEEKKNDPIPAPIRRQQKVTISTKPQDESSSDESSAEGDAEVQVSAETAEEVAARRARVRQRLGHRSAEPMPEPESSSSSEEEEEESEEEESSSEEEEEEALAATFVPRHARTTILEAKELERKERARIDREKARREERAEESRALVARVVTQEEREKRVDEDAGSDVGAPDDADDLDDPVEFEAWRLRELSRANRDKDEREAAEREAAETERRRRLTAEQRAAEDAENRPAAKPRTKWKFLQKYHHKGAFFMDDLADNDVRHRETDGAVGVDKFDRAQLPKVLQVKDFGFAGRTKYTHLVDQDTTSFTSKRDENPFHHTLKQRSQAKMAGQGDIDRPFSKNHRRRRAHK